MAANTFSEETYYYKVTKLAKKKKTNVYIYLF